jgi:hypothetical protein
LRINIAQTPSATATMTPRANRMRPGVIRIFNLSF